MNLADPNGIIRRSDVAGGRTTDYRLQQEVGNSLVRVWPGSYANRPSTQALEADAQYRLTVHAAATAGGPDRVMGFDSAAVLHGLPLLSPDRRRVHTVSPLNTRKSARVVRHQANLTDDDLCRIDGVLATSLARTACDIARSGNFAQALTALDSALRLGCPRSALAAVVDRLAKHRGIGQLRHVLELADGLSESVGESFTRSLLLEMPEVPALRLQAEIVDEELGRFVGRVDFLIGERLVIEFDGLIKYSGGFGPEPPWQLVVKEKQREESLRDLGYEVVRLTWDDLMHPARAHAKIRRGLRRAGLLAA